MANQVKNYFLAPSTDYPPNTVLSLGNVVISSKRAVPALALAPLSFPPPSQISSSKSDFQWTRNHTSSVKLGVWAKFLEFLDLGVSTDTSNTRQEVYSFAQMDTIEFFPDDEYVRTALTAPAVKHYLERQRFSKSVYMVVGIKSVQGATVKTIRSSDRGAGLRAGVDLALVGGPPVAPGVEAEGRFGNGEEVAFSGDKEFGFAFRVRKVRIRRSGIVAQNDYNRNTLLGVDDDDDDGDDGESQENHFLVEGLEEEDADFQDSQVEFVIDGDDQVKVSSQ
jgi:hypothetical protein